MGGNLRTKLFVRHGDEEQAIAFYTSALNALLIERHEMSDGTLVGATLEIEGARFAIAGANPKRDNEAALGGPRSPQAMGTTSVVLDLDIADVDALMARTVAAGALLRNVPETLADGTRVAAIIDPFGHIWAVSSSPGRAAELAA